MIDVDLDPHDALPLAALLRQISHRRQHDGHPPWTAALDLADAIELHGQLAHLTAASGGVARPDDPVPSEWISVTDAADHLDLSTRTIRERCANGQVHGAHKVGRDWLVPITYVAQEAA